MTQRNTFARHLSATLSATLMTVWVCLGAGMEAVTVTAPEYAIKAVFLYNLLKHTEWPPESALSDPSRPVVLAVIGEDPFGAALDKAVRGRTVRSRRIVVIRSSEVQTLKSAHVAFISASASGRAVELVNALSALSVLTVGDSVATASAGVAVNFIMVEGRVRLDVNQGAARSRHIELSSQLLKLARRVLEPEG